MAGTIAAQFKPPGTGGLEKIIDDPGQAVKSTLQSTVRAMFPNAAKPFETDASLEKTPASYFADAANYTVERANSIIFPLRMIATGAGYGAAAGSVLPGVGSAAGAVAGAIAYPILRGKFANYIGEGFSAANIYFETKAEQLEKNNHRTLAKITRSAGHVFEKFGSNVALYGG
ncbi:hypothetical protein GF327_03090, partial [Candidatus Woesearchaeota archaeon]|nr:hypothetical protein [Candidatus Woesearchaeota archaeon]